MADKAFLQRLERELTDRGLLVEAGWVGFRLAVIHQDAPKDQLEEMKMAFFGGAMHLYQSIMSIMESGEEPTEKDLDRMALIHNELQKFGKDFELRATRSEGTA
jgi:hypothetical protein